MWAYLSSSPSPLPMAGVSITAPLTPSKWTLQRTLQSRWAAVRQAEAACCLCELYHCLWMMQIGRASRTA